MNIYSRTVVSNSEVAKLKSVVTESNRVLFRAKTVFPFDLFPNELVVQENKVDINYGLFFYSKTLISMPIANINMASASTSIFFGTLSIEIEGNNENPNKVTFLSATDAVRARRFINGLVLCYKDNIDLSSLDLDYVKKKVEEIGSTA